MYQNVLVGTLATLNLLVSPLGPSAPSDAFVYTYGLKPNARIETQCTDNSQPRKQPHRSELELRVSSITDSYFGITLLAKVCATGLGLKKSTLRYHLPTELLDRDFMIQLPVGSGYVVPGIPSVQDPNSKSRMKITKLASADGGTPVRVEWIPSAHEASQDSAMASAATMTIWIAHEIRSLASVQGIKTGSLQWLRLQLEHKHPMTSEALHLDGELNRIDEK